MRSCPRVPPTDATPAPAALPGGGRCQPRRRRAVRGEGDLLRAQLLDVTRRIVSEGGDPRAITVRRDAEETGVSTPSVYLHFRTKDALLNALAETLALQLEEALERALVPGDPSASLAAMVGAYMSFALERRSEYLLATSRQIHLALSGDISTRILPLRPPDFFTACIEADGTTGPFAAGVDGPAERAAFALTLLHGLSAAALVGPHTRTYGDAAMPPLLRALEVL